MSERPEEPSQADAPPASTPHQQQLTRRQMTLEVATGFGAGSLLTCTGLVIAFVLDFAPVSRIGLIVIVVASIAALLFVRRKGPRRRAWIGGVLIGVAFAGLVVGTCFAFIHGLSKEYEERAAR